MLSHSIFNLFYNIFSLSKHRFSIKYKHHLFLNDSKVFFSVKHVVEHQDEKKVNDRLIELNRYVLKNNFKRAKTTFEDLKNTLTGEELTKAYHIFLKLIVKKNPYDGQKFIEEEMLKNKITLNEFTLSIWMKGYCNRGKPEKAEEVLRNFKEKYNINRVDEVLYNILIDAFGQKRK